MMGSAGGAGHSGDGSGDASGDVGAGDGPIGALEDMGTLNGVAFAEIERHLRAVHELLCQANMVRAPALASYNGWTADGRPVRHRFQVAGYERSGSKVEQERRSRQAGTSGADAGSSGGEAASQ